jgi:predicted nucleotidyltransferase
MERLRRVLDEDPRIAYAMVFGSSTAGRAHAGSDIDVAIGVLAGCRFDVLALGALTGQLEAAAGARIDLVLLDEAPPGLAYRVFRDGRILVTRDGSALAQRRARAILEYLDFQPIEEICTRGVLAARGGR